MVVRGISTSDPREYPGLGVHALVGCLRSSVLGERVRSSLDQYVNQVQLFEGIRVVEGRVPVDILSCMRVCVCFCNFYFAILQDCVIYFGCKYLSPINNEMSNCLDIVA